MVVGRMVIPRMLSLLGAPVDGGRLPREPRTVKQAIGLNRAPDPKRCRTWVLTQIYPDAAQTPPAPERVGGVLLVGLSVPPERDEEFNAWYNTEHLPFLAAVPGVLRARRFVSLDDSRKYLAVYELADPEVPRSEAFQTAAQTPWTARQRTWFEFWLRVRSRAVTPARTG